MHPNNPFHALTVGSNQQEVFLKTTGAALICPPNHKKHIRHPGTFRMSRSCG